MNEQRQQAYLNLIQSLLNCHSDNEVQEILVANQDLLDADFVEMVEAIAEWYTQQGKENTANWLRGFQFLSDEKTQAYFQFLSEIIQVTAESSGNAQVIYPLLAKNTDKLDIVLAGTLRHWGTNILREAPADAAEYLAVVIVFFSDLIKQFPLGDRVSNMEIAITGYEVALIIYTQQSFPKNWADIQNNLATAYRERIRGERAHNLEQAIACYQEALKVRTIDAFPEKWAATQNNLAIAYYDRIRGERAHNLEQAIACYQEALKVRTIDAFPEKWANTQNNLAIAYHDRIRGDRAHNLEQAITCSQEALKVYTFDTFPYEWAATQNNLANAYRERIKGERAYNLEQAIACLQEALKVCTFDTFPYEWAKTQNNLANAYNGRIRGERAQNLELAIAYYQNALKVTTFEAFPEDWAKTQNNLATAYRERIRGERAHNLEQAIAYYHDALKVYTFDAFPENWAKTQNNLATAYRERIRGERAHNLEQAIAYYHDALKVYTFDAFPENWADTQNGLAIAYCHRIRGERAHNLEQAITYYHDALKVYTFDAFPENWADTQNNLGLAYFHRIKGRKTDNLEQAIAYYQEALKVRTFDAFPEGWADIKNNLGLTYLDRIEEGKEENLEQAIAYYQEALKIRTFDAFPQKWAETQNNLGLAYLDRIRGEQTDNLEQGIVYLQDTLKVYTFEAFPEDWARTYINLANAYHERIKGERAYNLEQAIACSQEALKVYTFEAFPQNHALTLFNLGMSYQNSNQFTLAYNTFESAIATVESLREEIVSGEETKRKQAEEWNKLYKRLVEVCLKLGNARAAIEYVERSKTRNLVEQILIRDQKTIFSADIVTQLETYRDEIATGQYQIQNGNAENPRVLAQKLQHLRQRRNELQNRYLPVGFGFKFDSLQASLDEHTAIIEWYILNDKILSFIVTKQREVTVWQSQLEDRKALYDWANQYWQNYNNQKDQWHNSLEEELKKLASILHIDEILNQIPKHCDKLILIPHLFLHLFPIHAIPVNQNSENSRCLLDLFAGGVSYAPSCQLLQQVQQRKRPDFQSLFAIQNPTEDLNYTDLEVQVIQRYFNTSNILKKTAATLTAINNSDLNTYHCAHFSCHGDFNFINPSQSALILANAHVADTLPQPNTERYLNLQAGEKYDLDECLTLDKIFSLKLEKCRLVTLSACETGLIDFDNASDEYIGLPSGFLLAGSPSVVSSLWKVDDLSTSFLMIKFYENLFKLDRLEAGDVAIALKQAQNWLRSLTIEGLNRFLEEHKTQIEKVLAQLRVGQRIIFQESLKLIKQRQPLPFANPYYWAGFTASGL